jgi:hypothetical protein
MGRKYLIVVAALVRQPPAPQSQSEVDTLVLETAVLKARRPWLHA